ncbi:MAG TPA: EamA family transporter RarD [Rhizobacter sp.]|nr:EamA family transporter RarD [Rhizobacter sp.]
MSTGALYAALAFALWGLFPLFFKQLAAVPAPQILAHRIVWSLAFVLLVLGVRRQWSWLLSLRHRPRVVGAFAVSGLLLATNWLTYIGAVNSGHVIDSSLGYFITPLVNVLLGFTVLHERPRPFQWAAVVLAACGVVWLTVLAGELPWIALVLAASFGAYGLMRKIAVLGPLEGLALETMLLAPLALLALLFWFAQGSTTFPMPDVAANAWLVASGPVTAVPLLLFAAGARRISLTTLGLMQYIGPTLQLALGVWLYHETFGSQRLLGFTLIWLGLALYSAEDWWASRQQNLLPAA